jgi:ATP-dependent Clp protease adaptor protein ClpS
LLSAAGRIDGMDRELTDRPALAFAERCGDGASMNIRSADEPPKRANDDDGKSGTATLTRPKTKKPSMYKVLMLNDDYTPMEFVVHVLEVYFNKNREEATQIMLHVHQRGVGVCGVYTYEVAETKVQQTMDLARKNQHPLQCTLEKE